MKFEEKQKAILMRRKGYSITHIAQTLSVSKASISVWVRKVQLSDSQLKKLKLASFTCKVIEKRRAKRIENESIKRELLVRDAEKDFSSISLSELKIIGVMLYWAEGGKTQRGLVRISNSNPEIIKIMMLFFRKICHVPEKKFKAQIHTHSQLNALPSEVYWEKITEIPRNQFFKTYCKPSKVSTGKRNSLPYGTFDIYVCDTNLFLKILGWKNKVVSILLNQSNLTKQAL